MAKVTGLGGVFYKVEDPEATARWYKEMLGVGGEWGATFPFAGDPGGYTILSPFKATSDYFAPSEAAFMINLRVDDLDGMIAELEREGDRDPRPAGRGIWQVRLDPRLRRNQGRAVAAGRAGAGMRYPPHAKHGEGDHPRVVEGSRWSRSLRAATPPPCFAWSPSPSYDGEAISLPPQHSALAARPT